MNLEQAVVNEKMLAVFLEGGKVFLPAIPMDKAKEPFSLATQTKFDNPNKMPIYYEALGKKTPARQCCDNDACVALARFLQDLN